MKARTVPILGLLALFFALSVPASATDYFVNAATGNNANTGLSDGAAKATIQAAVDIAASNDVIYVRTGTYTEQVHIVNKSLTFYGSGQDSTIIRMPSSGQTGYTESLLLSWNGSDGVKLASATFYPVVYIDAANNTHNVYVYGIGVSGAYEAPGGTNLFVGVAVKNAGGEIGSAGNEVRIDSMRAATITDDNTGFGLLVFGRSAVTISHVTVNDYQTAGIGVIGRSLSATLVSQMPNPSIHDNHLNGRTGNSSAGIHAGILSGFGARATMQRNIAQNHENSGTGVGAGIYAVDVRTHLVGSTTTKGDGNVLTGNDLGMEVRIRTSGGIPTSLTIRNNNIVYNNTFAVQYDNSLNNSNLTLTSNAWGKYGGAVAGDFGGTDAGNITYSSPLVASSVIVNNDFATDKDSDYGYSDFETFQKALDGVAGSGTITMAADTYNLHDLTIDRTLTINGAKAGSDARTRDTSSGESVIDAGGNVAFSIQANGVTIDGFSITNATTAVHAPSSVTSATVSNNYITGSTVDAINLQGATSATVEQNLIVDVETNGITVGDDMGTGGTGDDIVTVATVQNNTIRNASYGISGYMTGSTITGNVVENSSSYDGYATVRASTGGGTVVDGIGISGQMASTTVSGNTVSGYNGTGGNNGGTGIAIEGQANRPDPSNVSLDSNTINDNHNGVLFAAGSSITFTHTIFDSLTVNYIVNVDSTLSIDAKTSLFNGVDPTTATGTQVIAIEGKIIDDHDSAAYGEVIIRDGLLYVTTLGTIQAAVDAAVADDIIYVASGTYTEPTVVITSKVNLTIIGDSTARPVISNGLKIGSDNLTLQNLAIEGVASGSSSVIPITAAITDLTWDNVKVDGLSVAGRFGVTGGQIGGDISITNSQFVNIENWSAFDTRSGAGTSTAGSSITSAVFTGNLVRNTKGHINFRHDASVTPYPIVTIANNIVDSVGSAVNSFGGILKVFRADTLYFTGNSVSDVGTSGYNPAGEASYGAGLMPREVNYMTVTGNTFTGNNQAIAIEPGKPVPSGTISNNLFSGNTYGLYVPSNPTSYGSLTVTENVFTGNTAQAVHNGGLTALDATLNWWGNANGPNHSSNKVGVSRGDSISDNVTYIPWWSDFAGTVGSYTGTSLTPITTTSPVGVYASLQSAINASNAAGTIDVAAVTLVETITVNKEVTIQGANAGISPNTGVRGAESVLDFTTIAGNIPLTTISSAAQVTIDGLKFEDNRDGITGSRPTLRVSSFAGHVIKNSIFSRYGTDNSSSSGLPRGIEISPSATGSVTIDSNLFTGTTVGTYTNQSWRTGIWSNGGGVTTTITNNVFEFNRSAINLDDYSSAHLLTGNTFQYNGTALSFGGVTPTTGSYSISGNTFIGVPGVTYFNLSNVASTFRMDATNNTFDGKLPSAMTPTELFALEDAMVHALDAGKNGLVRVVPGNVYVTITKGSIQRGLDIADAGDTVNVGPGRFAGNLSLTKLVTMHGSGPNFGGTTVVNTSSATPTIDISGVTATSGSPLMIRDLHVTKDASINTGGVAITNSSYVTLYNIQVDSFAYSLTAGRGIDLRSGTISNVTIRDCDIRDNNTGINTSNGLTLDGFVIDSSVVTHNSVMGLSTGSGSNSAGQTNFVISNSTFYDNGWDSWAHANSRGWANLSFFKYNGNLTMTNVEVTGPDGTSGHEGPHYGMQLRGVDVSTAMGTVSLTDVTFNGNYRSTNSPANSGANLRSWDTNRVGVGIYINTYSSANPSFSNVTFDLSGPNCIGFETEDVGGSTVNLADAKFTSTSTGINEHIYGNSNSNVDATSASFDGTVAGSLTLSELFDVEDRILHAVDDPTKGLVRVRPGNVYVTTTANVYMGLDSAGKIQNAIDGASASDTVNVKGGTYNEGITLAKALTVAGEPLDSNSHPVAFVNAGTGAAITSTGTDAKDVQRLELQIADTSGRFGVVPSGASNSGDVTFTDMRFKIDTTVITGTALPGTSGTDVTASIDDGNDVGFGSGVFTFGNSPLLRPGARYVVTGEATLVRLDLAPTTVREVATATVVLREESVMRLRIYDANGVMVRNLADGPMEAGAHTFTIDATDLPSGAYFLRVETSSQGQTVPMQIVR